MSKTGTTPANPHRRSVGAREKAKAVREFAEEYGVDLTQSFLLLNGAEDVPFCHWP